MRKALLALAVVLMIAPMAFAQHRPSPHEVDFEAMYWLATASGTNVWLCTIPIAANREEATYVVGKTTSPFVLRGVYRYKRDLGIGGQFYSAAISGSAEKVLAAGSRIGQAVPPAPFPSLTDAGDTVKAELAVAITAIDLYHVQNIVKTSDANYDLIGGVRLATTTCDLTQTATDSSGDVRTYEKDITKRAGKLKGPHIGITGSRRFLIDPLTLSGTLTVSLLKDARVMSAKTESRIGPAAPVIVETEAVTLSEPVQVIEGEVALKFSSPRMAGMGASIGLLTSQWENSAAGNISLSGLRAGLSFNF